MSSGRPFGHGSSPFMNSATSQACKTWKSLKRDHHNTNNRCASPMLLGTGLGSNSLSGSPEASTNGDATYAYRCRVPFLRSIMDCSGALVSSLLLLAGQRRVELLLSKA